jgi:two-component system, OmpR family, sensor histidine kinase BaeS
MTSLRAKLFLAHLLVIIIGVSTLYGAAMLVAPAFFEQHVAAMAGVHSGTDLGSIPHMPGLMADQLTDAFRGALSESLGFAAGAALVTATVVSLLVSRHLVERIQHLAEASSRIAAGHYAERVPANGRDELSQLASTFNDMAVALDDVERHRIELIGDVAHELRTPVATIEGYLEGLMDGVVPAAEETWAKLADEAGRLHRLADDLQQLSQAEAHQLPFVIQPIAPATIVQTATDRLDADFTAKGISFSVNMPASLPLVRADSDRAVQILTNLLTNALRYTPPSGHVEVSVGPQLNLNCVRFRVRDSGIGIAPEELTKVFERFYRVEKSRSRAFGGTGVGLTIAQALVEAMDGHIWAESDGLGQGATFSFDLPIVPDQHVEREASARIESPAPRRYTPPGTRAPTS